MTKQFCDRCGCSVDGKASAAVQVVGDADALGDGRVTDSWDLCRRCLAALRRFVRDGDGQTRAIRRKR